MRTLTCDPTDTTSIKDKYQPGEIRYENHATYGARYWRYVKNTQAIPSIVGHPAVRDTGAVTWNCGASAAKQKTMVAGVWQSICPAGYYGWVLCGGAGTVLDSGAGVAADADLIAAVGGVATVGAADGAFVIGCTGALIAGAASGVVIIDCL